LDFLHLNLFKRTYNSSTRRPPKLSAAIQYNAARPAIISRHAHLEVALFGKVVLEGEMGMRDRIGWDEMGWEGNVDVDTRGIRTTMTISVTT